MNGDEVLTRAAERIATPDALKAWLRTFGRGETVGFAWGVGSCPIARFIATDLPSEWYVSADYSQLAFAQRGSHEWSLRMQAPDWARGFAERIDNAERGTPVSKERAQRVLRKAILEAQP